MTKRLTRKDIQAIQDTSNKDLTTSRFEPFIKAEPLKRKLLREPLVISILGLTALTNSAYAIIAPFLPFSFKKKEIDQSWIGYIFSIYSVAVIVCSPMVGKMISFTGRRNLIMYGLVMMGSSFIVFGIIEEVQNKTVFITMALLNRFLQGFSSSLIQTTMYSICTNFFPEDKDAMVGYIEAVTGVGLILGPLIGSALYSLGGYVFIFYSFGSLFVLSSFFIKLVFKRDVDGAGFQNDARSSGVVTNSYQF